MFFMRSHDALAMKPVVCLAALSIKLRGFLWMLFSSPQPSPPRPTSFAWVSDGFTPLWFDEQQKTPTKS